MPQRTRASLLRYPIVIDRENICYLSWTVDAYEGLGFLRTDDASEGRVSLFFTSDYRDEVEKLLDTFVSEGIGIERAWPEIEEEPAES